MNESLVEVRRELEGAERCGVVNGLRLRLDGQQRESLSRTLGDWGNCSFAIARNALRYAGLCTCINVQISRGRADPCRVTHPT